MEVVEYQGWRCQRVTSGEIEALITLDVGPRVIRLGRIGGKNLFYEKPETLGKSGGSGYNGYGGHRLWIAPESETLSYYPENEAVEELGDGWLASKRDSLGLQRRLRVLSLEEGKFQIEHEISMEGDGELEIAPWALSVMNLGGTAQFPIPPFQSHNENFLPVAPMVLWSYTNFSDPRWEFLSKAIRLKQTDNESPQKAGMFIEQGWASYFLQGELFVKTFGAEKGKKYPDFGCNFETFTRHDMLELESLAPLSVVRKGDVLKHVERWQVLAAEQEPDTDSLQAIATAMGCPQL